MRYWVKIEHASKIEGKVVLGVVCVNGVVMTDPFITFWAKRLENFSGMPTHYIDMPEFRPDEDW